MRMNSSEYTRRLQVKVEHELKLPLGEGAALQLDEVQPQGIEPGQDLVQGAGPVGQDHHEGGLVRPG